MNKIDLNSKELYFNRELSWLRFNTRVLDQAKNEKLPLLERVKFLAIYSTNLDEFYMIRVAGLMNLYNAGVFSASSDQISPLELLEQINLYLHREKDEIERVYLDIFSKLKEKNLFLKKMSDIKDKETLKSLKEYFYEELYPVIIPIIVDSTHPFPHFNNLSFAVAVKLQDSDTNEIKYGIIRVPRVTSRFIEINKSTFVPVESIVINFIDELFSGHKLISSSAFRVTRNADIAIEEEEADDFMELLEEGLRSRRKGEIVRLEIEKADDNDLSLFLRRHIKIDSRDLFEFTTPLNLGSFWQIVSNKDLAHLTLQPYSPKNLPPLENNQNILSTLDSEDILLYHPYESFEPIVRFINEASKDDNVLAIRMTLYRVGSSSPIVKSLIDASLRGKQVTVLVELKARFDEENNLIWAKALESAGAHVVYGLTGLKVHAKVAQVTKRVGKRLKHYVHIGTGNYNPSTAKIYTDISYFTSNKETGIDAIRLFHSLTGVSKRNNLQHIITAPLDIKPKLLELIEQEIKHKDKGHIIAKMNSLVDADIIKALYRASMAGVQVELIVRGICCLKPNMKGVSENIKVVSIIGKYLEHARILYFKNSTPNIFISSADWMPRNLERRVEIMFPIYDKKFANELLEILKLQLQDDTLSYTLQNSGEYSQSLNPKSRMNSHTFVESYVNKLYKEIKKEDRTQSQKLANRLFKES
jgi:polyphosphate kinase